MLKSPAVIIPKGRRGDIKYDIYTPPKVTAPITKNQPVGNITAVLDGETVFESYIVAANGVQKLTFFKCVEIMAGRFFGAGG